MNELWTTNDLFWPSRWQWLRQRNLSWPGRRAPAHRSSRWEIKWLRWGGGFLIWGTFRTSILSEFRAALFLLSPHLLIVSSWDSHYFLTWQTITTPRWKSTPLRPSPPQFCIRNRTYYAVMHSVLLFSPIDLSFFVCLLASHNPKTILKSLSVCLSHFLWLSPNLVYMLLQPFPRDVFSLF